jgi:hypothetical protein
MVRNFIHDRYLAGTAEAEAQYQNAAGDEDTLTGALGALVSTSGPVGFSGDPMGDFVVQISFRKVRGRGQNAPEKRFGTDGIFQLQVTRQGHPVFRKGLPFQAKKNWKGRDRRLADQARDMKQRVGNGIVIDYTPKGYAACEIDHVIEARGNRKAIAEAGQVQPLGQVLAHRILDCEVGIQGLYYDDQSESFVRGVGEEDLSILDTSIAFVERRWDARREQG